MPKVRKPKTSKTSKTSKGAASAGKSKSSTGSKTSKASGTGRTSTARKGSRTAKGAGKSGGSAGSKDGDTGTSGPPGLTGARPVVRGLVMAVAFAAMVAFAVVLAKLTLVPSQASVALTHTNLRPGSSIRAYTEQPAVQDAVKQIGGNVVLGVPFGLLLPVLVPWARGLLRVGLVTAVVMLLVELVQGALVTGRAFDVDDVILNTAGALLGYLLLGRRMGHAVHPRRRHWWHRFAGRRSATE